jgi:dienelactone hydrolase
MFIVKELPIQGSYNKWMGTDIFFVENKKPKPVIVYIHGFNGFKDWGNFDIIARQFAETGFVFVKMNLSHNGTTLENPLEFSDLDAFGRNTISFEIADVGFIISWLKDNSNPYQIEMDTEHIILLGHSKGGATALLTALQQPLVCAVVTWASVSEAKTPWGNMSMEKLNTWKCDGVFYYHNKRTQQKMPIYYSLYEDYIQHELAYSLKNSIQKLSIPLLICHGTEDTSVPFSSAEQLKKWQPRAELFLVQSDHVFGRSHPWEGDGLPMPMQEVVNKTISFLHQHLPL